MKRAVVASLATCFCVGLLSLVINASQIPTAVAAAKKPVQKENAVAVPQAGKNGYTNPRCIHCPQPQYTDKAFREKVDGTVTLSIVVLPDGRADDVRVVKSLENGLDHVSMDTVRKKWRFKPALGPDGKPAAVQTTVEIDFHLLHEAITTQ